MRRRDWSLLFSALSIKRFLFYIIGKRKRRGIAALFLAPGSFDTTAFAAAAPLAPFPATLVCALPDPPDGPGREIKKKDKMMEEGLEDKRKEIDAFSSRWFYFILWWKKKMKKNPHQLFCSFCRLPLSPLSKPQNNYTKRKITWSHYEHSATPLSSQYSLTFWSLMHASRTHIASAAVSCRGSLSWTRNGAR